MTDNYSKQICQTRFGFKPNKLFPLKIELVEHPTLMTLVLFSVSIFIFSFIVRIFEMPYQINDQVKSNSFRDFESAVWMIIITITTVGYGDIYPQTRGGRIVCILTAFWGTFIVSLMVLVVTSIFDLKHEEKKAIQYIKQSKSASKSISKAFRFFFLKKKFYIEKMNQDPEFIHQSSFLKMIFEKAQNKMNLRQGTIYKAVQA